MTTTAYLARYIRALQLFGTKRSQRRLTVVIIVIVINTITIIGRMTIINKHPSSLKINAP